MSWGSLESTGASAWMSAFTSGDTTRPSRRRRASTPATRPCVSEKLGASTAQAASAPPTAPASSNARSACGVATHSVRVSPKRASDSLSSSSTAETQAPSSRARETSAQASATPSPVSAWAWMRSAGSSKAVACADAALASSPISARKRPLMALMPYSPSASTTASAV